MDPLCVKQGLSEMGCNAPGPGLYVGYVLCGVALVAAIVLPLINAFKNPQVLVKLGISLGILVVLFGISYGIADGTPNAISKAFDLSEFNVRLVAAGLIMFYITMILAIVGVIYSEISKALK